MWLIVRTPLNLTDSLETFLSLFVFALFSNFNSEDIAWFFLFTSFVDEPKFSYSLFVCRTFFIA